MRIAHLTDTMAVGGAEVLIAHLCRRQRERGHEPSVHCLFRLGAVGEGLRAEGYPVFVHGPGGRASLVAKLARTLRADGVEVVHCHNATPTIIGAPAAWLAGVRTIISTRHGLVAPPYGWRREIQFSLAARLCHAVVAVCETAAGNLRRAPLAARSRILRVYNGAVPAVAGDKPPLKKGFTVVSVGRLTAEKDHATLIRAIALVAPRIENVHLWLVGGGPLEGTLRQLAADLGITGAVTFFGEQRQVGGLLGGADLFVLSSVSEGLPVSLLEAMAAGLPVVTTDAGGMPEVVRPSGCGIVVPSRDPEAMAAAIEAMAGDRTGLVRMGALGRAYFSEHFTVEKMEEAYDRLYRGMTPLPTDLAPAP